MWFPKRGKSFPKGGGDGNSGLDLDDRAFAGKIGAALRSELKTRNSRAKLVAGWTGANERTVKNWISGRYAPCGRHLVVLAQHSDQILNAILLMADRQDLLLAASVEDLRRKIFEVAAKLLYVRPETWRFKRGISAQTPPRSASPATCFIPTRAAEQTYL
jgi:hypothetical protein